SSQISPDLKNTSQGLHLNPVIFMEQKRLKQMGIRFIANMAEQVGQITQIMPCRFFIINPILDGRYCLLSHGDNNIDNIYTFIAIAGFLDNIEQSVQYNVAKSNQYLARIPFISFIGMEFFQEYGEILF